MDNGKFLGLVRAYHTHIQVIKNLCTRSYADVLYFLQSHDNVYFQHDATFKILPYIRAKDKGIGVKAYSNLFSLLISLASIFSQFHND